jgi:electron transfer flavoprotein beta subunit
MKIVVLIKQVPDTYGERRIDTATHRVDRLESDPVIDEISERAIELALRVKDGDKGTEVILLAMGPAEAGDALRKGLSLGADAAIHILDDALAGADAATTARVLAAAAVRIGFDLIVAGNASTDGGGGIIPVMIGEQLKIAALTNLNSIEFNGGSIVGARSTDQGTTRVSASLPAVISVTERSPEARFPNFKGIRTAKKKPLDVWTAAVLGVSPASHSVVLTVTERPARTAGTKVIDEGNAGTQLAGFLAAAGII